VIFRATDRTIRDLRQDDSNWVRHI